MATKSARQPGPDHPITIEKSPSRVVVSAAGRIIADSRNALTLREAAYPPVQYFPREDVDMALLQRSETSTYCPYKGEAAYYSLAVDDARGRDAVWSYEAAYPAVSEIEGYLAFYPDRVAIEIEPAD